uniref:Uncharacterized protein n=1 Tax=Zea mays TaxID=4577 RepID=C0HHB3_MAIZE|nr:unknown [Zea mays]
MNNERGNLGKKFALCMHAGPQGGQLVAAVRQRLRPGVLAVVPLLVPGGQRLHDRVGRRGGELGARRQPHQHADGQRPLPRGRVRQGQLLQERPGGGLHQQPQAAQGRRHLHRAVQLLRRAGRQQRRLGHLLLLRRAREELKLSIAQD